jgi:sporulenol synthase
MSNARGFLLRSQNGDGGWGYRGGATGMSYVEPTAAVVQAMPDDDATGRARDFLLSIQHKDGGWGIAAVDDESGWMTSWAVLALAQFPAAKDAVARGVGWLVQSEGLRTADASSRGVIYQRLQIDSTLRGWPWQPGDTAWVHPTALAILALSAAGHSDHPRVQDGVAYLFDRAVAQGGWNIGNPEMLGKPLPSTIQDTAVSLLALTAARVDASNVHVRRSVQFLQDASSRVKTPAELAWAIYALRDQEADVAPARAALNVLQSADGGWASNPFITATVLLGQA